MAFRNGIPSSILPLPQQTPSPQPAQAGRQPGPWAAQGRAQAIHTPGLIGLAMLQHLTIKVKVAELPAQQRLQGFQSPARALRLEVLAPRVSGQPAEAVVDRAGQAQAIEGNAVLFE